ncbi:uncharacterized protein LOC128952867 [Oppia nitens]|uniref:uncharacterized protein LOC128952867 n=1 Tax=Oppia nitens TaxID=1686743 RepID=UPI0023DBBC95|nr:uncharacterized protein LOC128952867 [Oppia nitens]
MNIIVMKVVLSLLLSINLLAITVVIAAADTAAAAADYDVNGLCGRPERPFESRLIPVRDYYREGDEVGYQCNQYWNYMQTKRCVRGQWIGHPFTCGKTALNNDLNYVKVEDISSSTSAPVVLFDENVTLSANYKFANSFLSSRCETKFIVQPLPSASPPITAAADRPIRWTLGFEQPLAELPFFRINFHLLNVSVTEALAIDFNVLNVSVGVGGSQSRRTCRHVFKPDQKKLWRRGTKVELNFECQTNSPMAMVDMDIMNMGPKQIVLVTSASPSVSYKLIMILLGQSYSYKVNDDDDEDKNGQQFICGEPEQRLGQMVRPLTMNINYSIDCNNNWDYVSKDNPDLPDTTIHKRYCSTDMRWKGTYPECIPRTVCPVHDLLVLNNNNMNPVYKIVRFDDVYYYNNTQWYAIEGTTVSYQCSSRLTQVLLGDSRHVCGKNGQWIGSEPNCFDLSALKLIKQLTTNNNDSDIKLDNEIKDDAIIIHLPSPEQQTQPNQQLLGKKHVLGSTTGDNNNNNDKPMLASSSSAPKAVINKDNNMLITSDKLIASSTNTNHHHHDYNHQFDPLMTLSSTPIITHETRLSYLLQQPPPPPPPSPPLLPYLIDNPLDSMLIQSIHMDESIIKPIVYPMEVIPVYVKDAINDRTKFKAIHNHRQQQQGLGLNNYKDNDSNDNQLIKFSTTSSIGPNNSSKNNNNFKRQPMMTPMMTMTKTYQKYSSNNNNNNNDKTTDPLKQSENRRKPELKTMDTNSRQKYVSTEEELAENTGLPDEQHIPIDEDDWTFKDLDLWVIR